LGRFRPGLRFGAGELDESGHELRISGLAMDLESNRALPEKASFRSDDEAKKPLFRP